MATPPKGRADFLTLGDWNVVCFECGIKKKASTMQKHWQGYWVCPKHWEPRQTQDFVKGVPDQVAPPWVQPEPADAFAPFCSPTGNTGIAGYAVAGCFRPSFISPFLKFLNQE